MLKSSAENHLILKTLNPPRKPRLMIIMFEQAHMTMRAHMCGPSIFAS